MAGSDLPWTSVVAMEVKAGREARFLAAVRELHALVRARGYGSEHLLRDARNPRLYYEVRAWNGVDAAARGDADPDVKALWTRVESMVELTHLTGGVRSTGAFVERRGGYDRRSGVDRRAGRQPPPGVERRQGDRRAADRRGRRRPIEDLLAAARQAREYARAPHSRFRVGAALETASGAIITGANIENATYGLTMCAERVALFKALSDGYDAFRRIVVVAETTEPTAPCGPCRQMLWEYAGDLEVVLANLDGETGRARMSELLPLPFDARLLP